MTTLEFNAQVKTTRQVLSDQDPVWADALFQTVLKQCAVYTDVAPGALLEKATAYIAEQLMYGVPFPLALMAFKPGQYLDELRQTVETPTEVPHGTTTH